MAAPIAPTASRYSTVAAAQAVGPAWSARPGGFLIDLNGSFSSKGDTQNISQQAAFMRPAKPNSSEVLSLKVFCVTL